MLPCLQFIYWSLVHIDQAQGHQVGNQINTFNCHVIVYCWASVWCESLCTYLKIFIFQKTNLVSTLRRLGEEMYKPRVVKFNEDSTETSRTTSQHMTSTSPLRTSDKKEAREGAFFKSTNLHVRMLSALIILKTLTQGMDEMLC